MPPRFLDRLKFDAETGSLHDGDIRYMMIRGDTLMGLFARLPEPARQQALAALTDSTFEFGSKSATKYRAAGAADPSALLNVIVETAPQLGWGSWTFTERAPGRLVLEVRNSPFARGFGASPKPVCAPISGMLRAVSSMVLGGSTAAEEIACAAQSGDVCCFTARKLMRILIPDAVFPDDHALERATAGDIELEIRRAENNAGLDLAALETADAVVGYFKVRYDAGVVALAKRCRIFVRAGVGVDKVDIPAWSARGIPVCNVPDYGTTEIADHALGMILALARGLTEYQRRAITSPAAAWALAPMPVTVRRLRGTRLLIVGFGAVGRALARRALAMDMRVVIYSPTARDVPADVEQVGDLDAALATADVISLHAPLKPETRHLLNRERLERLKPGVLLVNTARGALIDLKALYDGLRSGPIAGAALDVWEQERPVDDKLFQALMRDEEWLRGRLIVTPHVAWASADAVRDMRVKAIETARDFLTKGTLRNCLNPKR